jgi:hypothetical protein
VCTHKKEKREKRKREKEKRAKPKAMPEGYNEG